MKENKKAEKAPVVTNDAPAEASEKKAVNGPIIVNVPEGVDLKTIILSGSGARVTLEASTKFDKNSTKAYKQNVVFDYNGHSLHDVLEWASSERRIAWQRAVRAIESEEQFVKFMEAGDTMRVPAREAGHKPSAPKTPEQTQAEIAALMSTLTDEQKKQLLELV